MEGRFFLALGDVLSHWPVPAAQSPSVRPWPYPRFLVTSDPAGTGYASGRVTPKIIRLVTSKYPSGNVL